MSDAIFSQIAGGLITLNDALRESFERTGSLAFLIKSGGGGQRWEIVRQLASGWYVEFSEYRNQFKLLVATLDPGFSDDIARCSYLAYGVPDAAGEIEVFHRDPDRCDIIPPTGANAQWKIYYERAVGESYALPQIGGDGDIFIE